jgi:hypothetical protein
MQRLKTLILGVCLMASVMLGTKHIDLNLSGREVISVDRNSRGQERLGRAVLLIAEGVRITLLERSRVPNAVF